MEFDHVQLWVGNAKQAASYYTTRFGFQLYAYRGLETGSRDVATWVVRQNKLLFAFSSQLNPVETDIGKDLMIMGDAVKDVALLVSDVKSVYEGAVQRGAKSIQAPVELKDDHGSVIVATIATYGNVWHSLVQRTVGGKTYAGTFLPGYKSVASTDPLEKMLPEAHLEWIDHIVGNQPDHKMEEACVYYEKVLGFHRFWSVDDKQIHTEYSSLRSIVMASPNDSKVKMPINEPANGKRKSQIQEYVDYHGGAGVQHVALRTNDIIKSLTALKQRGAEFLKVPSTYYEDLRKRIGKSSVHIKESLDRIQELNILVDFDDHGYLLQIFSKPVQDRPTLFYEVIQREGHEGFGAGNFKALFESIERDQESRGNL